jgi:hypothetical protein
MKNISKKAFLVIFLIIVSINFLYALSYKIKPAVDAEAYDEIATNIVEHEQYRSSLNTPIELDNSITRIGPGYEFFLATNYLFFGRHLWIIWLFQAILYGLTIIMLGMMSIKLFPAINQNPKIVYSSMLVFGLLIDIVQLNAMLMTESLFLFLLTLSFFIWSKIYNHDPKIKFGLWIILGFVLGFLTLTRPTGLLVFILLSGATIYRKKLGSILAISLLVIPFILIQVPWLVRNYHIYNQFVFHSSADGLNFLSGNYPGNHGEFTSDFPYYKELKEKYESPVEMNREAKKWYKNFVFEHPIQATKIILEKVLIYFSLTKTSGFWFHYFGKTDQILTILISILQNFIILGSIILYGVMIIKRWINKQFLLPDIFISAIFGALAITPIISVIANRHRLPLVIMSLPLFIYVAYMLKNNFRKMKWEIIITILVLIFSTSFDLFLQFDKFKSKINSVSSNQKEITINL